MKNIKKIMIFVGILIGVGILLILLNAFRIYLHYSIHKNEYVPSIMAYGTSNHYIPQGLAYSEKYHIVLQTSYHHEHQVSMLYVIDFETKELLKELRLYQADGKENTLHVGGIATNDDSVWITNDYQVSEYRLEDILETGDDYVQSFQDAVLPIRGDFCTFHDNTLWIGEFYLKPFYDVENGVPLLMGYQTNSNIQYAKPEVVISLPKMVQGLTFNDQNQMVFTCSYTYLIRSSFLVYENVLDQESITTMQVNNKKIPYYQLTKKNLVQKIKIPPMAEGLFYLDGSYYILFESNASDYYLASPKLDHVIQYKTDKD